MRAIIGFGMVETIDVRIEFFADVLAWMQATATQMVGGSERTDVAGTGRCQHRPERPARSRDGSTHAARARASANLLEHGPQIPSSPGT